MISIEIKLKFSRFYIFAFKILWSLRPKKAVFSFDSSSERKYVTLYDLDSSSRSKISSVGHGILQSVNIAIASVN